MELSGLNGLQFHGNTDFIFYIYIFILDEFLTYPSKLTKTVGAIEFISFPLNCCFSQGL